MDIEDLRALKRTLLMDLNQARQDREAVLRRIRRAEDQAAAITEQVWTEVLASRIMVTVKSHHGAVLQSNEKIAHLLMVRRDRCGCVHLRMCVFIRRLLTLRKSL